MLSTIYLNNICYAQNLIKNPGFESGSTPVYSLTSQCSLSMDQHPMPTDWSIGPINRNCSGNGEALVFDDQFVVGNCPAGVQNRYGVHTNIYQDNNTWCWYVDPEVRAPSSTNHRYMGFYGSSHLPFQNPQGTNPIYGGNIVSELEEPLEAGCLYRIGLHAIPVTAFGSNKFSAGQANHFDNRIEIVFYKDGIITSCPGWVAFTTVPITNSRLRTQNGQTYEEDACSIWINCEAFFTVPDDMDGLDHIQIRLRESIMVNVNGDDFLTSIIRWRPTGVFVDDLSLTKESSSLAFTPSTNYAFSDQEHASTSISSPWSSKNIEFHGEFIVDQNLTINSNSKIRFGPNAKLIVKSPSKLTIDNSVLDGGCSMWDGIVVESGGKIEFTNNKLYDAKTAIKISGPTSEFIVHTNLFEASVTHLELNDCKSNGTSNTIYGNKFFHEQPLKDLLQTATGKGLYGIVVSNTQSTNMVSIGIEYTTSTSDFNWFKYGHLGINIYRSNAKVSACYFFNNDGIVAKGTPNTGNNSLTLWGSEFYYCRTGLLIEDCYNFYCQVSDFYNCSNYAMIFRRNYGKTIQFGYTGTTSSVYSKIYSCKPGGILLQNNGKPAKSAGERTGSIQLNFGLFKDMQSGTGIIVTEGIGSRYPHYKKMEIRHNVFYNVGTCVKLLNIVGNEDKKANGYPLGMPYYYSVDQFPFINLVGERVIENIFHYENKLNPDYLGIKAENTRGVHYGENTYDGMNPSHWQNKGIWLDNCTHSQLQSNEITAGTGILAAGNMLQSNFNCNNFYNSVAGIQLGCAYMRGDPTTDFHGKLGVLSRQNGYTNIQSFGMDIELWNSGTDLNKWVYDDNSSNDPLVIQNPGSFYRTTALRAGRGPSFCTTTGHTNELENGVEDVNISFSDSVMNWNYKYYVEKMFASLDTLKGSKDSSIAKIIEIEDSIHNGGINDANNLLEAFIPKNNLESNYAYLLGVYIEMQDTNFEHLDSTQIVNVDAIASKQSIVCGIPVHLARAILLNDVGIDYSKIDDDAYPSIKGKLTDTLSCIPDTLQGICIAIVDENFHRIPNVDISYTNEKGEFTFDPYLLRTMDSNLVVGFSIWPSQGISILNPEFKPIYQWIDSAYKPVLTTAVYTTLRARGEDVPVFTDNLEIVEGSGLIYSVFDSDSNFIVKKNFSIDSSDYQRTLDGFLNIYDTAIGIKKHHGNLYVVSNFRSQAYKGFDVWCLDTFYGNLIWKKTQFDSSIFYEALGFDTLPEGGVQITVKVTVGAEEELQLLEVRTCQMYFDIYNNYLEEEEGMPFIKTSKLYEPQTNESLSVKIIPNPNKGSFSIQLGQSCENCIFELYNLRGILLFEQNVKQGVNQLELTGVLGKGMYIGRVTDTKTLHRKTFRILMN